MKDCFEMNCWNISSLDGEGIFILIEDVFNGNYWIVKDRWIGNMMQYIHQGSQLVSFILEQEEWIINSQSIKEGKIYSARIMDQFGSRSTMDAK